MRALPRITYERVDTPPVDHRSPLDKALDARYWHRSGTRARLRRAVQTLLDAIATGQDVETYAQIKFGFWYKVYFFTPAGAWKSDTGFEHLDKTTFARAVIKAQDLRRVPMSAVFENWRVGKLWEHSRPLSALVLQAWEAGEEHYYDTRRAQRQHKR